MKDSAEYKRLKEHYIKSKQQVLSVLTYLNASLKEINECLERDSEGGNINGTVFFNGKLMLTKDSGQRISNNINNNIIPEIDRKIRELDRKIQECLILEKQENVIGEYYE